MQVFTIGHSTHPLEHFLALLSQQGIDVLVDIRRFPGSRRFPRFNRENLATTLPAAGISYQWHEALGGRRSKDKTIVSSRNLGLRNEAFRNSADYMLGKDFRKEMGDLAALAEEKRPAIMCAESAFWRCHRRLVSDFLVANGVEVQHIMPSGDLRPHSLTEGATVIQAAEQDAAAKKFDKAVIYPGAEDSLFSQ
jgi:uncharacterized protein (DUF488 family)